ncbi:hypothetical protein HYX19_00625 [Candidatus Woesearchaeota archaeon]|nr:hypothetical protein [Candidatus Woesearchaeota archaeon]
MENNNVRFNTMILTKYRFGSRRGLFKIEDYESNPVVREFLESANLAHKERGMPLTIAEENTTLADSEGKYTGLIWSRKGYEQSSMVLCYRKDNRSLEKVAVKGCFVYNIFPKDQAQLELEGRVAFIAVKAGVKPFISGDDLSNKRFLEVLGFNFNNPEFHGEEDLPQATYKGEQLQVVRLANVDERLKHWYHIGLISDRWNKSLDKKIQ